MSAPKLDHLLDSFERDGDEWDYYGDIPPSEARAELDELKKSKKAAENLLQEALELFDSTLSACEYTDDNEDAWLWAWKVKYFFGETDIPAHATPEDMKPDAVSGKARAELAALKKRCAEYERVLGMYANPENYESIGGVLRLSTMSYPWGDAQAVLGKNTKNAVVEL